MDVHTFGSALVESGDLDPIYLMLKASNLAPPLLKRWCLAYWMFYHAGVASKIAQAPSKDFWMMCWKAQAEKWPRGVERRHFKAENSRKSIEFLEHEYGNPVSAVDFVSTRWEVPVNPFSFTRLHEIMRRAQTWVGFGPWIAYKIADMSDAVLNVPVDFEGEYSLLFEDPVLGAACVVLGDAGGFYAAPELVRDAKMHLAQAGAQARSRIAQDAVILLQQGPLGKLRSPVADRLLALQEYETVLCKYKSHLNGHYPLGKDTREILEILEDERWGSLAKALRSRLFNEVQQRGYAS